MERTIYTKRISIVLITVCLMLSFIGCGNATETEGIKSNDGASQQDVVEQDIQDGITAEKVREYYGTLLDNQSEDTAYAALMLETEKPILILTDGIFDEGSENQASIYGTVYYYADGECLELGEVVSGGTAYPLRFSENGIYAEESHGMTKYVIDETTGQLVKQKIWSVVYNESGEDVYTFESFGNTETLTEEEWYTSYEEEQDASHIIHFAYEVSECINLF